MRTFNNSGPKISRKIWPREKFFFQLAISLVHKSLILVKDKHARENFKGKYAHSPFFSGGAGNSKHNLLVFLLKS
jgi:hypothetical protein